MRKSTSGSFIAGFCKFIHLDDKQTLLHSMKRLNARMLQIETGGNRVSGDWARIVAFHASIYDASVSSQEVLGLYMILTQTQTGIRVQNGAKGCPRVCPKQSLVADSGISPWVVIALSRCIALGRAADCPRLTIARLRLIAHPQYCQAPVTCNISSLS